MEFRGQPRLSDQRRCGKASLLKIHYSRRSATTNEPIVPWSVRQGGRYDFVEL